MSFLSIVSASAALVLIGGCAENLPETPPRQLTGSPFHYPEELWDAGVEGETLVRIYVTTEGTVDSAEVEKTSGYAAFDSAAIVGAYDLRFEPALRGDEPASVWVLLPVEFDLPMDSASSGL